MDGISSLRQHGEEKEKIEWLYGMLTQERTQVFSASV